MRYAAKRDANEQGIVLALQLSGADVVRLSEPGVPDLLVHYRGRLMLFEVKTKHGTLTPAQVKLRSRFPFAVLRSVDDVATALRAPLPQLSKHSRVRKLRVRA